MGLCNSEEAAVVAPGDLVCCSGDIGRCIGLRTLSYYWIVISLLSLFEAAFVDSPQEHLMQTSSIKSAHRHQITCYDLSVIAASRSDLVSVDLLT